MSKKTSEWEKKFDRNWIKTKDGIQYWVLEGLNPEEVKQFIKDLLREANEEGFKKGFKDCQDMVRKGEHANCCLKPKR